MTESRHSASERPYEIYLFFTVIFLFAVQAFFSINLKEYLNLEAAAESLRSPYWLSEGTVFNGISTAVGYSATLAILYEVFGFTVYMAKWYRLALHALSLISVTLMLRKFLGSKLSILPMMVMGLSPTWIFYNYEQAQFGYDLQTFPIILAIATLYKPSSRMKFFSMSFLIGVIFIWSALSYPTILFCAPFLIGVVLWHYFSIFQKLYAKDILLIGLSGLLGVATVIAGFLLYVKDPQLLIYDPATKAGILRGGGGGFTKQPAVILDHYATVIRDLIIQPASYGYWIPNGEFNFIASRLSLLFSLSLSFFFCWKLLKNFTLKQILQRPEVILFAGFFLLAVFCFNFPQLIATFAGMRRITGFLIAFYGLLATMIFFVESETFKIPRRLSDILYFSIIVLIIGHSVTLVKNYRIAKSNIDANTPSWFKEKESLASSLEYWEQETRAGKPLHCERFISPGCRYSEIYGAIQGMRKWNNLKPAKVPAWDPINKKYVNLEIRLWEEHVWPHE